MTYKEWLKKYDLEIRLTWGYDSLVVSQGSNFDHTHFQVAIDDLLDKGVLTHMREAANRTVGGVVLRVVYGDECIKDLLMHIAP